VAFIEKRNANSWETPYQILTYSVEGLCAAWKVHQYGWKMELSYCCWKSPTSIFNRIWCSLL